MTMTGIRQTVSNMPAVTSMTGDFSFENEWQRFHTKKDRGLKLKTPFHERNPRRYKIAAKVMDIFGNAAMKLIEVSV